MHALVLTTLIAASGASAEVPAEVTETAIRLRDAALRDETAYRFVEDLTTEVGPRLAGTADEARARKWSVRALKKLGFAPSQISVEPFRMETWVRGTETARVVAPYPQPLVVTALGRSGSTGPRGMKGEVVVFRTIDDLERAKKGSLRGKIAYIGHSMPKTQDGAGYAYFGRARFVGPSIAAKKGAKAVLIRSVGTHSHRLPHTGVTGWPKGVAPIPSAALSPPDADQLERMVDRGERPVVFLKLTPRIVGMTDSGNIVVDLKGSDRAKEIVIVGGHLDSWDLGTGAVDDGAGVAITTAAVRLIQKMGLKPRRTIRLVHFGAEEVGLYGAEAYLKRHDGEAHVIGSESDFGAENVIRVHAHVSDAGAKVVDEMLRLMRPLGVLPGIRGPTYRGSSGPDLSPLNREGLPRFHLVQNGFDYFDLHHTPDDTFDKINPRALAQNVAAYVVFLWIAANVDVDFRPSVEAPTVKLSE